MGKNKLLWYDKKLDSQVDLNILMNAHDVGVFPARAEGFNLELLELLSLGKPCIATNYSAHTEFTNSDNCYLIDIDDKEPCFDFEFFFGLGTWAKLGVSQCNQLKGFLRKAYDIMKNEKMGLTAKDSPDTISKDNPDKAIREFTWEQTATKILNIL